MEDNELIKKINDNNRLLLTKNDFAALYRYALAARKVHNYYLSEGQSSQFDEDKAEKLNEKAEDLLNEFLEGFNNPFDLDMEFDSSDKSICFEFYDYEYMYRVIKCKKGWRVEFFEAFYCTEDHEDHSLGVGYEYNVKENKFYPVCIYECAYGISSVPFKLTLQP